MKPAIAILLSSVLLLGLTLSQCRKEKSSGPVRLEIQTTEAFLATEFSGERAFDHVEKLVGLGPRPPGSDGYAKMLTYLEETLASYGWTTTRQPFRAATPDGPVDFVNLLARHRSADASPDSLAFLVGGHIDTKQMSFPFVGANDGGSSTGVMLEMARVLSTDPASAAKVELVFFDGEEAFRPGITPTDGLYGSKYFAHDLSTRPSWPATGIVLDIVGDPNYPLFYNPEAQAHIVEAVESASEKIHFAKDFKVSLFPVLDDHVPLQNTGLDCLHLIGDFSSMPYWHNETDTLDKISSVMLEKVGRLTLDFMAQVAAPVPESP